MLAFVAPGCATKAPASGPDGEVADQSKPDLGQAGTDMGAAGAAYLLYETFNQLATASAPDAPFAVDATGGAAVVVREVPFAADKSTELAKPTAQGTARLTTSFPAQSGRVVFEAKVKALETAGFKAIPYIYDTAGDAVASVLFQDGDIKTHIGNTTVTVQPFVANVWYRVRVVVDTNAGTFDLYVDGVRKETAQPLRMAAPSVSSVAYFIDGTNVGTLHVDNVKVYNEAALIGAPPQPVFDPRSMGAAGDGKSDDTAAIQMAIDAAAGTGGSVLITHGTFLSGTLTLKSNMTFFIDPSAVLRGSANPADYPDQTPATGNTQLSNCKRALLYAPGTTNLTIDGGGTIDGQGDRFGNTPEATRPILIWAVLSDHTIVRNLYLMKGAVWSLVSMESDHVRISNVNVESDGITHDGIDVVDGTDVTIEECAVRSGDDAMCLKSGVRRGIDTLTVRNSLFGGSSTSSNGIKLGTGTYGAMKNIAIEDCYVKDVQYAAMAVESRQGSDVDGVHWKRIELANTGAAFFVYLAQQDMTHPIGDVPKLGSMNGVSFTDISGWTSAWGNSPHQGSLITGHVFNGTTYPITNLSFTNVAITFDGGLDSVPPSPPEAMPNQYPESNMFHDLPAWGYYLRHVAGVTFASCTSSVANPDARKVLVADDVTAQVGSP
jgi:hypothetical protein